MEGYKNISFAFQIDFSSWLSCMENWSTLAQVLLVVISFFNQQREEVSYLKEKKTQKLALLKNNRDIFYMIKIYKP